MTKTIEISFELNLEEYNLEDNNSEAADTQALLLVNDMIRGAADWPEPKTIRIKAGDYSAQMSEL